MKTVQLVDYLDDLLRVNDYQDYAPNGLQVAGRSEIQTLVTGVTASQALIEKAILLKADAVLVHHGYFWKNESATITGMKKRRIKLLLENDINLIAYHLPLDGHAEFGNNAQLAKLWKIEDNTNDKNSLLRIGGLANEISFLDFKSLVDGTLNRESLHLPGGKEMVKTIAWCSGGAQGYIEQAVDWGADVYISGEVSEQTMHVAKEEKIHYLSAGHHATERLGVQSLGKHLQAQFNLNVTFVDIPNPV
jgi:dinuclear metal center YbgI/SA1388 family protein